MKQMLKKIGALTMVLTILVSSHSFAYFEHLCTITQIKSYSLDFESCARVLEDIPAPTDIPTLKKGTCCEISLKVNKPSTSIQSSINFGTFVAQEWILPSFTFENPPFISEESSALFFVDSAPPHKIDIYILNQQFII